MRVLITAAVVLVAVAGLFVWAFNPSVDPTPVAGDAPRTEASEPREPRGERRSVLDEVHRSPEGSESQPAAEPDPEPEPETPPEPGNRPKESPLTGLSVASVSSADLRQQGVPDAFEGGVVVTEIEPDSPADEVALSVGDIIVEARMKAVRQPGDLESIVGDHSYAKVTFIRDGQVLQVVLQRPFRPK